MDFSYNDYKKLIALLKKNEYEFCDYHNYEEKEKCVILRHDIDSSIEKAYEMACLENRLGVTSTWFILLRTDFYNLASYKSLSLIHEIQKMGHEIGLHFDEMAYNEGDVVQNIVHEADILSRIIEVPITTVSMHRPSKKTIEADYEIPEIINSYGRTFFNGFKYLSDSRRHWREPVEEIIESNEYMRLHILTHAFWYSEKSETIDVTIRDFVRNAKIERYNSLKDNIRGLEETIRIEDI